MPVAQLEKGDYIPLPATEPHHPQDRRRKFLRFSAYVLLALLGFKTVVHTFAPSWPPHFPKPPTHAPFPHHRLTSAQRDELFLSIPNAESAIAASRAYATHPHLAGSSEDFEDAKVILELFQSELGISPPETEPIFSAGTPASRNATLHLTSHHVSKPSAWVDVYYPVLNTPLDRSLQILGQDGSVVWEADLVEDGDPLDEDAAKYRDAVPTWHGLSKDGDAEGQLVYANYGTKADYDELVAAGVDLKGKIVITRYGEVFRGLKIKAAQELGAAAVLIYSDPRDDGYVTVENGFAPYPAGPARNPTSVQRGSVQFLSSYPGDPTTPGYPAYKDAERTEGTNIPKIPSLPISFENGVRLLEEIGNIYVEGKNGKKTLSGKASASKVKLVNHVDTKVTPIWNAMAAIPGHIKDEVVIVGGHRDAWVLGAADPTSGTVSLHEIIRGFGALLKKGWKPLRTVVIASWDAEEYGLIGSTEWGEDFSEWISKHAVAYLNVDTSASGSRYNTGGSPSLANLIKEVALEIPHPTIEGKNLWDARNDEGPFRPASDFTIDSDYLESYNAKLDLHASKTGVRPLGSGSDYTVFLQRLGVASLEEGFGRTPTDAAYHYHSIYDTQRFQEIYADPGFHRHVAVAKHLGLLTLRIADSFVLPLNITQYAFELDEYLDNIYSLRSNSASPLDRLDLSKLSKAIKKVQNSSVALEKERHDAEKDFKRILRKLHRHFPHPHPHCRKSSGAMRRVKDWIKGVFGVKPHNYESISDLKDREVDINAWAWHLAFEEEDVRAIPPPPPFAVDRKLGHHDRKPGRPKHHHPEDGPERHKPCHGKHRHEDGPDFPEHRRPDHPDHSPDHPRPDHPEHRHPDHPDHSPDHPRPDHPEHRHSDHPEHGPDHPKPDHPEHRPEHGPKHRRPDHPKHCPDHHRPGHPEHRYPEDGPKHRRPDHPEHCPDHPKHRPEDGPKHRHPDHPEHGPDHHKHRHPKDGQEHRKPGRGKHCHFKDSADSEHHGLEHPFHPKHWPGRPPKEIKKLVKAAKRIVKANKKIIAFERGFISEDGIKDREWYKHLGVAPGKWLGYGATTFPALAEALEFDKNVTLAEYEAHRLTVLLEKLAHTTKP